MSSSDPTLFPSISIQNAPKEIRQFLKKVEETNKVVSYEYLEIKFGVTNADIMNLLRHKLYDMSHLVVGRIKDFFLITTTDSMMDY